MMRVVTYGVISASLLNQGKLTAMSLQNTSSVNSLKMTIQGKCMSRTVLHFSLAMILDSTMVVYFAHLVRNFILPMDIVLVVHHGIDGEWYMVIQGSHRKLNSTYV